MGEQQPTSGSISYNGECTIGYLPQQMRVADTTTLVEETAKAFDEVLKLEAEIARLTREIAERTDYESSDYESLLHRLNEATQYNEADYKAYNELKAEYDHQMHEWEKASYELEITEGE